MMLSPIGGAIGTPASYLLVLWWHKDRVSNPPGPDPASRLQNRAADPVLAPFKFLFAAYRYPTFLSAPHLFVVSLRLIEAHNASHDLSRPDRWWYEVIETFRRLTMTALLLLFKARQHQHHGKPNFRQKHP